MTHSSHSPHESEAVTESLSQDVASIATIDAVPTMLEVICRSTGMGFCAIARVTEDRWIACAVRDEINFGLVPGGELVVQTTICDAIRKSGDPVVIDDVAQDDCFREHPTPRMYGFRSYISVPIRRADGMFFGTLCAIDPRPARLNTPRVLGMFKLFADLIAFHLEAQDRVALTRTALLNERQTAELREQFIAVLAHDLSDPLAAIAIGAKLLSEKSPAASAGHSIDIIRESAARMQEIIAAVTDFARGRLGGGFGPLQLVETDVRPVLRQVLSEIETAWPARSIDLQLRVCRPIVCDRARLAQLLTNLVTNALRHGELEGPVRVDASTDAGAFEISVSNGGEPIPPSTRNRLFQPFARGASAAGAHGLGLGLYIASEIARAHGGALEVDSTAQETRFTFRMPLTAGSSRQT